MGKRQSSLERRFEAMEVRLHATETRLRHMEAYCASLIRENKRLKQHVAVLQEKVRDLTARLSSDSSNSSKPPSSDVPWKERRKQKPTGRKPGGQPEHKGKTRKPFPPAEVDRTVTVVSDRCGRCRSALRGEDAVGDPLRHQVIDIPPVVAQVIEYVLHNVKCTRCGEITSADLPEGVPPGCASPRFQAIMALLTGRCRITRREAREIAVELFGEKARVSLGTVSAMEARTSDALADVYDEALGGHPERRLRPLR